MVNIIIKKLKLKDTHESPLVMLDSFGILSIGAIFAGYLFKDLFVGHEGIIIFGLNQLNF